MQLNRRHILLTALQLFDLAALGAAAVLGAAAYSQRLSFDFEEVLLLRVTVSNVAVLTTLLALCHLILRANGIYQSRRLSTRRGEVIDILKAVTMCALVTALAAVAFRIELMTSRSFLTAFWTVSTATLVGSRFVLRMALTSLRRRGRNLRQVLIVGTNPRAADLAMAIEGRPELGYHILGFADERWPGLQTLRYPLVTDLRHLSEFLRETVVDEVFVCLPVKSYYENIRQIIERCENQGIVVRLLGHLFDLKFAKARGARVDAFADETVLSVYTGRMNGWPVLAKRIFDLAASLLLLVALSPVFLLTAAALKLFSPGPVFFIQERVGFGKRRFRLFKFRTMVTDAEQRQKLLEALNEARGPVFKIRNDPRITPLGRFLRKTSIDELPQLINVLKGDMSLVGPRPLPVRDCNGFEEDWHRRRFSVRPGITCLWQVNGRSNICFDHWMELDMQYIDQWSLWLDVKILMKTVPAVIRGSGAA